MGQRVGRRQSGAQKSVLCASLVLEVSPNLFSDLLPSSVKWDYFILPARASKQDCGGAPM